MYSEGKLGDLGEPNVSLLKKPEDKGYRQTKSPGAGWHASSHLASQRWDTNRREASKVLGRERQANRPEKDKGSPFDRLRTSFSGA
jgi:hypothetical protein